VATIVESLQPYVHAVVRATGLADDEPREFPMRWRKLQTFRGTYCLDPDWAPPEALRAGREEHARRIALGNIRVPCPPSYPQLTDPVRTAGAVVTATTLTLAPAVYTGALVGAGATGGLLLVGVFLGLVCVIDACARSAQAHARNAHALAEAARTAPTARPSAAAVPPGKSWTYGISPMGWAGAVLGPELGAKALMHAVRDTEARLSIAVVGKVHEGGTRGAAAGELCGQVRVALDALHWPDDPDQVGAALQHALQLDWMRQVDLVRGGSVSAGVLSVTVCVAFRDRLYVASLGDASASLVRRGETRPLALAHVCDAAADAADPLHRHGLTRALTLPPRAGEAAMAQATWLPYSKVAGGHIVLATGDVSRAVDAAAVQSALCAPADSGGKAMAILHAARSRGVSGDQAAMVLPV
jgi:hypothetical protein